MIQESWGKGVHFFIFHFFLVYNSHLNDGVAWFDSHSTSRMLKISFLKEHQIIFFEIKIPDQVFKTPIGKWILVQEMNCVYEITRGFKGVFVSSYKKTPLIRWIMLGREQDWMTNSLFHWNFGKRNLTTKILCQHEYWHDNT